MKNEQSIPEILEWSTAGFEQYLRKHKKGFSRKNFMTYIQTEWLVDERKLDDIFLEIYWQMESIQEFLAETLTLVSKKDCKNGKKENCKK